MASKLNVPLAEDNKVNQALALRLLEKRAFNVVVAQNGEAAIEAHSKQKFDIILMDIQMPVMSGFDATRAIRAQETATGKHNPIIAMIANVMAGDREKCLASGMDAYVAKPLNVAELFETIEKLVPAPAETRAHLRLFLAPHVVRSLVPMEGE